MRVTPVSILPLRRLGEAVGPLVSQHGSLGGAQGEGPAEGGGGRRPTADPTLRQHGRPPAQQVRGRAERRVPAGQQRASLGDGRRLLLLVSADHEH